MRRKPEEVTVDIRRKIFLPEVSQLFAFLVDEHDCLGPEYIDEWSSPGGLEAIYHADKLKVRIGLWLDRGDEYVTVSIALATEPPLRADADELTVQLR